MEGLTAIVTGGSSGIGLATAKLFLENGARVVLIGRQLSKLNQAMELLGSPERTLAITGDVSSEGYANKMIFDTKKRFGSVNILINCAGIFSGGSFLKMGEEDFDSSIGVNLKGTWFMCKFAARAMLENGGGAIVNIASTLASRGVKSIPCSAYAASKGGVIALTNALAVELAPQVRVNCVIPGAVNSPIFNLMQHLSVGDEQDKSEKPAAIAYADQTLSTLRSATVARAKESSENQALATVQDVAQAIFALSDPRSDWVTGEKIVVGDMDA